MIPGTIRLFSLWIAMGLISTPGITVISWVFYKLEVLFFSDISVWFWRGLLRMSSVELALTIAVIMSFKLCLWFVCCRRTFQWARKALHVDRDIEDIREAGLIDRVRALFFGPLMAHHERLIKRLKQGYKSKVFPISMGLIPFFGAASVGSLIFAAANDRRKFLSLVVTNFVAVFTATLLFRELIIVMLSH